MQKKQSVTDRPTDGPTDTVAYRSRVRDKKDLNIKLRTLKKKETNRKMHYKKREKKHMVSQTSRSRANMGESYRKRIRTLVKRWPSATFKRYPLSALDPCVTPFGSAIHSKFGSGVRDYERQTHTRSLPRFIMMNFVRRIRQGERSREL